MTQFIEAVFENGVFRPLQPVDFPEHQRVILQVPELEDASHGSESTTASGDTSQEDGYHDEAELDEEIPYEPLPLRSRSTIRVKIRTTGKLPPVPYSLDDEEYEDHDDPEES